MAAEQADDTELGRVAGVVRVRQTVFGKSSPSCLHGLQKWHESPVGIKTNDGPVGCSTRKKLKQSRVLFFVFCDKVGCFGSLANHMIVFWSGLSGAQRWYPVVPQNIQGIYPEL